MENMVLNHLAAVLFFSGPIFYIGLWMTIDPAGVARIPELVFRASRSLVRRLAGLRSEGIVEHTAISRRLRTALRFAGVTILLLAIVI